MIVKTSRTFVSSSTIQLLSLNQRNVITQGRVGYGGFVGLKVVTYDFSRHIIPATSVKPSLRYQFVKAEDQL